MNPLQAISLIEDFNPKQRLINNKSQGSIKQTVTQPNILKLLDEDKKQPFANEVICYIEQVCPDEEIAFSSVGHPLLLLSKNQLSWKKPGFQIDAITKLPLDNWHSSWFIIATEGSEPIFINIDDKDNLSPVYSAMKTEAGWDVAQISDSIGQFLLCIAAINHALNFPEIAEPLDEAFNLNDNVAKWFFPLIKLHANNHYDEWAAVFENFLDDFSK